jgi:hypothetical protein
LSRKCGSLDLSQPYGPPRPLRGIALPLPLLFMEAVIITRPHHSGRLKETVLELKINL